MTSIRALPVIERWDCHGCGYCCRSTVIPLDRRDLEKLAAQKWHTHPDFRGVRTTSRGYRWLGRRVLAKKPDGSCVFLSDQGRCRIHEEFGSEAKPAVCRMFPLQVVPLGEFTFLTPRRSCPSAAADRGQPIARHIRGIKRSGLLERFLPADTRPPTIAGRVRRPWREFLLAADTLGSLITDERFPLVRRIVHGLEFCKLLEKCKLRRVTSKAWPELMHLLHTSAPSEAGAYFTERSAPSAGTSLLFRQLAVHFVRAHPRFAAGSGWRERYRMMRSLSRFARGTGGVPAKGGWYPEATFESLERPLGPLPESVARPLNRFFETHAASKQYAIVGGRRSLIASYRTLALTFPLALWLLRLSIGDRDPTQEDMIDIVVALDRGQGLTAMTRAASAMAAKNQLAPLVAWYAR